MRIATWNVFHGQLNPPYLPTVQDRVDALTGFGAQNGLDLICFQEMPQGILEQVQVDRILFPGYAHVIMYTEYPNPPFPGHGPASQTSDGYLILYNPRTVAVVGGPEFFLPQVFIQAAGRGAQARPPVQLSLTYAGLNVNFLTWHTEATKSLAAGDVLTAYEALAPRLDPRPVERWILAGDLNVDYSVLANLNRNNGLGNQQFLSHHESLDYIITSGQVYDPAARNLPAGVRGFQFPQPREHYYSDHHLALFGIVLF
jgi:hypothetical protein